MTQQANSPIDSKKLVLVIDKEDIRTEGLMSKFQEAGAEPVWCKASDKGEFVPEGRSSGDLYDLVLIHAGDIRWLDDRALGENDEDKLTIRGLKWVYFGGRGGNDPRIPPEAERIWRPVSIEAGGITLSEARDLIRYVTLPDEGFVPLMLRPASSFPLLRTLGVLTVGYLAVEAADRFRGSQAVAGEAYERLGWGNLSEDVRQRLTASPGGLLKHRQEVNVPEWWLGPIETATGGIDRVTEELKRELREAQGRGLEHPEHVQMLVTQILQNGKPPSATVESAFQSLSKLEQW